jgi:hypothetical protein
MAYSTESAQNDPGLRAPFALLLCSLYRHLGCLARAVFTPRGDFLPFSIICALASSLFYYADHRDFAGDPAGIVADRWQIVLVVAGSNGLATGQPALIIFR